MANKIKNKFTFPKSTEFTPRDLIVDVKNGHLYYKSNYAVFRVSATIFSTNVEVTADTTIGTANDTEVLFNSKKESIFNYEKSDIKLNVEQTPNGVELQFPIDFTFDEGSAMFYRADDKSLDREYKLTVDSTHKQILNYTEFIVGKYEINISWNKGDRSYLYQSEINF